MLNEGLSKELTNLLFLFLSKFLFFLSLSSSLAKEAVTLEVTNISSPLSFHSRISTLLTIGIRVLLATMAETRSSSYINELIATLRTTTNHHAHSLQEITQ